MARSKESVSRSQQIRDYLVENPAAKPSEIVAALAEKGVKISASLASYVLYHPLKGEKRTARRRRSPGRPPKSRQTSLRTEDLFAAKKYVDRVGDINKALEALTALASLI